VTKRQSNGPRTTIAGGADNKGGGGGAGQVAGRRRHCHESAPGREACKHGRCRLFQLGGGSWAGLCQSMR